MGLTNIWFMGCSRGKNSIIRAKLMYRSGKETVTNILLFNILIYLFSPRNSPNLLKLPPSRSSKAATQQALKEDSLKETRLGSWGQTLLKLCLRRTLKTLEHAWYREVIPITWWTKSSPKLNSKKERTPLHKHRKRTKEFYPLWHNFIHHCHVWKTF